MERKYYEAYDDRYRQVHGQQLDWFMKTPSSIVGEVVERYSLAADAALLEIGCGEGRDARYLLERGYNLLATDVSEAAVRYCRERFPQWQDRFQVLDCVKDRLEKRFDLIYGVAVVHMLVLDEDRKGFYGFFREHLTEKGIGLICTMGDGETERASDAGSAFDLQERVHEPSGRKVKIAGTSYRAVSFPAFRRELEENGLEIQEEGFTDMQPDYFSMMYAVVKRRPAVAFRENW